MTIRFKYNRLYTSQDTSSSPFMEGTRLWCSKYRIDSYIRSISNKSSSGYILLSNQLFYTTKEYSSSNYDWLPLKSVGRTSGKFYCADRVLYVEDKTFTLINSVSTYMDLPKRYGGVYGFASPYKYESLSSITYSKEADLTRNVSTYNNNNYPDIKKCYIYKVSYNE